MRIMFVKCKLIHADLSEFNLLIDSKKQLYVIDVSQSVEQAHPNALEFLRMDCRNVTDYFAKRNTLKPILSMQQLFNYITDPTINDLNEQAYLDKMFEQAQNQTTDEVDQRVFQQIFIPQTLDDLSQTSSKDFRQVSTILGMNETMTAARLIPTVLEEEDSTTSSTSSSSSSTSDDDDSSDYASAKEETEEETTLQGNVRPRDESPTSKRTRKQAVREQKREKRKTKIPKHVKKRAEKIGGDKRKRKG
jgi:RIO kinase 1